MFQVQLYVGESLFVLLFEPCFGVEMLPALLVLTLLVLFI